jgi:hypothetical protein
MQIDLSGDCAFWDNTEQGTYTSTSHAGDTVGQLQGVLRRALNYKELQASGGAYVSKDLVFLVPRTALDALLGSALAKAADVFTDAQGGRWTVLEAALIAARSVWRLVCRNPVIAYDLEDLIDVQRAAVSYDDAGGPVRAWPDNNAPGVAAGGSTPYQQVPCRVQLLGQEEADERGCRGMKAAYSVFLSRQLTLTAQDRVKWVSGGVTYYLDVRGQHQPRRIDELPVLDCALAF